MKKPYAETEMRTGGGREKKSLLLNCLAKLIESLALEISSTGLLGLIRSLREYERGGIQNNCNQRYHHLYLVSRSTANKSPKRIQGVVNGIYPTAQMVIVTLLNEGYEGLSEPVRMSQINSVVKP